MPYLRGLTRFGTQNLFPFSVLHVLTQSLSFSFGVFLHHPPQKKTTMQKYLFFVYVRIAMRRFMGSEIK
jgi:hypothetical protein